MKLSEEKQITKFTYASSNLFPFKLQTTKEHEEKKKRKKKSFLCVQNSTHGAVGLAVKECVRGNLGGKSESAEGVHDEVHPQQQHLISSKPQKNNEK
jgi:hypothetical protein